MIDLEESAKYVQYGILVFREGTRKLYYRPKKLTEREKKSHVADVEYELIAISEEEKAKLGIIEESAQKETNELEIEESAQDDSNLSVEEKLKKVREAEEREKKGNNLTLSGEPNAVASAKKILEDAQAKQRGEPTKEELAEENEHLKTSMQLLIEKEAIKRCDELGITNKELRDDFIAHPDKISAYKKGMNKEGQKSPAGSAPLSEKQGYFENRNFDINTPLAQKVYPSYEAMIQDLHDREAVFQDSPKGLEAKRYLDELTRKFFEVHKEHNSPAPIYQKPMPKLISVNNLLIPEDPTQGDLQERNRIFRRRKLLERQERGSVTVKGEDKE